MPSQQSIVIFKDFLRTYHTYRNTFRCSIDHQDGRWRKDTFNCFKENISSLQYLSLYSPACKPAPTVRLAPRFTRPVACGTTAAVGSRPMAPLAFILAADAISILILDKREKLGPAEFWRHIAFVPVVPDSGRRLQSGTLHGLGVITKDDSGIGKCRDSQRES